MTKRSDTVMNDASGGVGSRRKPSPAGNVVDALWAPVAARGVAAMAGEAASTSAARLDATGPNASIKG